MALLSTISGAELVSPSKINNCINTVNNIGGGLSNQRIIKNITYKPNEGLAEFELLKAYINNAECDMVYVETPYVECDYVE